MTTEKQYRAAKSAVTLIERTADRLSLHGTDHVDLLHRITTNELRNLKPGEGQINVFANEVGRIVDRVHLLKREDHIDLITSPGNAEKLTKWIDKFVFIEDVILEKPASAIFSLFGPDAPELLQRAFGGISPPSGTGFVETDFEGESIMIAATPELNLPGFHLIVPSDLTAKLVGFLNSKNSETIVTLTEKAYDILRIEAGWPAFGRDFDEKVNPHEAGMLPYIDFDKGCYVGQEVIARLDTYEKVQKRLTGLTITDDQLPKPGDALEVEGTACGQITSVANSFDFGNIALGYIKSKFLDRSKVKVKTGSGEIAATMNSLPFRT